MAIRSCFHCFHMQKRVDKIPKSCFYTPFQTNSLLISGTATNSNNTSGGLIGPLASSSDSYYNLSGGSSSPRNKSSNNSETSFEGGSGCSTTMASTSRYSIWIIVRSLTYTVDKSLINKSWKCCILSDNCLTDICMQLIWLSLCGFVKNSGGCCSNTL